MDYQEIVDKLKERALRFHHILAENNVYIKELSESEFLELVNSRIERAAQWLYAGDGAPWMTLLTFPSYLLSALDGFVYRQSWDSEEGIDVLLEEFQKLFDRTPFPFSWKFDEEKGILRFQIGDVRRSCKCESFDDLHWGNFKYSMYEAIDYIESSIRTYLKKRGWYLALITSEDQVGEYLLLPLGAVDPVRTLLILSDNNLPDERTNWIYKGLPDDKKGMDIWSL